VIPQKLMKGPLMWAVFALMLAAVLFAGVWDLASNQAEQRIKAEQSTQEHIEYAEDRIDEKCLTLEPMPMRDCIHKEIESARDHSRANQDLNAQQQMAFFTKIMAWTTAGGLALGAVSIVVIYATLSEMGRTNQIMREEQRPWVWIKNFQISKLDIWNIEMSDYLSLNWEYDIENTGASAATGVLNFHCIFGETDKVIEGRL